MKRSAFVRTTKDLLLQGYGVEDIAIRIGCAVDEVRRLVKALRATGELKRMFGGKG